MTFPHGLQYKGLALRASGSGSVRRMLASSRGKVALGAVNPLLALIPLIDAGPGSDSDYRQLVRDARALPRSVRRISGQPK
jgi:AsmA protein